MKVFDKKYQLNTFYLKLVAPTTTTPGPTVAPNCDGIPSTDWSCCSSSSPCNVGGGDCDFDSHCASGLTCGNNNCLNDFSSSGSGWSSAADCCEGMFKTCEVDS